MWKTALTLACAGAGAVCHAAPKTQIRNVAMVSPPVADSGPVVLQNRFFTKQMRVEAGLSAGSVVNESYSQTQAAGARLGLFVSEKIGVEYNFAKFSSKDSADLLALRSQEVCAGTECRSITPHFIRLENLNQLQLVTAPVYGKINLFDWAILYSDLTFSAGAAFLRTSQGSKLAFTPSFGQRFYFSKSFSLRLDATDIFLRDTVTKGIVTAENWRHNWFAQIGISTFLNSGE